MSEPIQPIVPEGTPLPTPPVGVPPYPITPFAVWTWSSPVIPDFYWNVYSSEQRIKSICKEIGKIEAYLQYLVTKTNENIIEIHGLIQQLTERVAALEKKVEEEVARLDGLIAQLRADLEQEIADREQGDANLDRRITQEIHDRQDADQVLHNEISQETQDRIHADDTLHDEISTETQDRIHADDQLHDEISHRLLPTDVQAGSEIEITRPDPNSNTIVIASTVAHSIADLASTVSGLQAALTAETEERRADDAALWTAVNNRIERGKILAGTGIKVENDPDSSTVTISATGGGTGGATEITGTAPITVTDGEDGEKIVGVSEATESEAGVISEARVRELAGEAGGSTTTVSGTAPVEVSGTPEAGYTVSVASATEEEAGIISESRVKELASGPSLSAEAPLKLEDGELSLTKDPAGPVTSSEAGLSVREITPDTLNENRAGVVSKATIKSLAASGGAYPGVAPLGGLEARADLGGLTVKGLGDSFNPIGVNSYGELMLTGGPDKLRRGSKEISLTDDDSDDKFFTSFTAEFLTAISTVNNDRRAVFVLPDGYFEVKTSPEGEWEKARVGTFELFAEADRLSSYSSNSGWPIYHQLYVRLTPRGQAVYTNQDSGSSGKTKITALKVTYSVYNLFIRPEQTD